MSSYAGARGEVTNRIVVPVANSITIIITRRFDTCNLQHNISWKKVLKQTPVPLTIIVKIILNWPSKLGFQRGTSFSKGRDLPPSGLAKTLWKSHLQLPI